MRAQARMHAPLPGPSLACTRHHHLHHHPEINTVRVYISGVTKCVTKFLTLTLTVSKKCDTFCDTRIIDPYSARINILVQVLHL